jgi:hypothetical protein
MIASMETAERQMTAPTPYRPAGLTQAELEKIGQPGGDMTKAVVQAQPYC